MAGGRAMASVWIARQTGKHGFKKLVAVKTILPKYASEPRFQRMFQDEARIASRIEHVNVALRLSPRARIGTSTFVIGAAHFLSRRFDEAEPKLLLAVQEDPSFPLPYRILAACYAHMGRLEEAREIVERLWAITPVVIPNRTSYLRNPEHRELLLAGLRLARRA